mgnify:CR=1 FL=1
MTAEQDTADLALLRRFEPILRLNRDERFLPAAVDRYVSASSLRQHTKDGTQILVPAGALTLDLLADAEGGRPDTFLQFVSEEERRQRRGMHLRGQNLGLARLARVGFLGRFFDVFFRASLVVRATVPRGVTPAAAWKARRIGMHDEPVYYGRVVRDGGWTVLHYQFFYAMNDWRSTFGGVNDHEGDWEQVMVFVEELNGDATAHWVAYSTHDHSGDDLRRAWDDPEVQRFGDHPIVFAGGGSHAGYFQAGQYVTRVEAKAIDGVKRFTARYRKLLHIAPPPGGFGIPFIDHADGDGVSIGPGAQYEWSPRLLDPWVPWVADFRGLWGLDTTDRTGGERAPSGPRFNRDGSIRQSWVDPVGYAGLQKVAPPSMADDIRRERLEQLEREADALHAEFDAARTRLRAEVLVGGTSPHAITTKEAHLARLRRDDSELRAERRRLQVGRPAPSGRRSHLHRPPSPDPLDTSLRGRILNVWVMLSVPIVLGLLAVAAQLRARFSVVALIAVVALMAIESILRKRVLQFLWSVFATALLIGAIGIVVYFAIRDWQWTLFGVFGSAALAVLVVNVREKFGTG